MDSAMTWADRNFGSLELGDARRSKRLPQLIDQMCQHPGGTLPDKLSNPADLRAFYRIVRAKKVSHSAVMASHYRATRDAISLAVEAGAAVLIIHDATELDYTTLATLERELGQIGQGSRRGYICHNSLAVRADTKETLGLTSQILHHRADVPKGETGKQRRERQNRESRLWVRGAQQSGPTKGLVVDVSDSLSDTFEYMAFEMVNGRHFVLRVREDRTLAEPVNGEHYLFAAVRSKKAFLEWEVTVSAEDGRASRVAHVQMSFSPVVVNPPRVRSGDYANQPLMLWAVRVWEPQPPEGAEAVEWILLTNVETKTPEEARGRVRWYECRFIVEELHKGMKTGCRIEDMQFTRIDRLEPAIGILSALTTKLMQLRDAARMPDAESKPATAVVAPEYVEVIQLKYPQRTQGTVSVATFYLHVARLGGHQNRKSDGFPGWITLWRGWMKLEQLVLGYRLAKRKMRKICGTT